MALRISPRNTILITKGEELAFALDVNNELGENTVDSVSYTITDSDDVDVTANFGGGHLTVSGLISFGVIAHEVGKYDIQFIVTCNEMLPNGTTPIEFYAELILTVE